MTVFFYYYGTTRTDLQLNTTFTLFDSLNSRINTIAQLRERERERQRERERERCTPDGHRDISRLGFLGRNGVARLKVLSVKKETRLLNKRRNCTHVVPLPSEGPSYLACSFDYLDSEKGTILCYKKKEALACCDQQGRIAQKIVFTKALLMHPCRI